MVTVSEKVKGMKQKKNWVESKMNALKLYKTNVWIFELVLWLFPLQHWKENATVHVNYDSLFRLFKFSSFAWFQMWYIGIMNVLQVDLVLNIYF
jgi:hypothetical protein